MDEVIKRNSETDLLSVIHILWLGCHRLADFMDKIKGAEKVGGKLYKKNCDEYKYGHSCFKFAGKRMLGKG